MYVLGHEVQAFEEEFAAYLGAAQAVGVGNGTDALALALRACAIGGGEEDEVITTAHTAVATVAAIEMAGARPVLVDIEPRTFTLDPQRVVEAITPRTKAIVAVHLYGQPADLDALQEIAATRHLQLIEDCAQAHGATWRGQRVGTFGAAAAFSFYPTKNLGAIGDGGAVVTNSATLAAQVRRLREYGWERRYVSSVPGVNSRLDELQAAILRVKLRSLDAANQKRAALAEFYDQSLARMGLVLPYRRCESTAVHHLYVVRSSQRDVLQEHLKAQGVGTLVHYPVPVHQQPAYAGRVGGPQSLPHTEQAAREVLSLPLYPELTREEARQVVTAVGAFAGTELARV